jgi:hypothetical protein
MLLNEHQRELTQFHSDTLLEIRDSKLMNKVVSLVLKNIQTPKITRLPTSVCPIEEELEYEKSVEKFMKRYIDRGLGTEDINLLESVI